MKKQFEQWLVSNHSDHLNEALIQYILSKLDNELRFLPCYDETIAYEEECERIGLWLEDFFNETDNLVEDLSEC